ncbi:hypothetical protein LCGC14_2100080, partial [marine sediment metagenome]
MKKHIYIFVTALISLFIVSCGNDAKKEEMNNQSVVKVQVNKVSESNNNPFLSVSGHIQSVNNAELSTRMMGFVTKAAFNVGDKVNKDQVLVSINNA